MEFVGKRPAEDTKRAPWHWGMIDALDLHCVQNVATTESS